MPSPPTEPAAARVAGLIAEAAGLWHTPDAAEACLREALAIDPDAETALVALYRFLFYRARHAEALTLARQCVARTARELGLPEDWRAVVAPGGDFADPERPRHRFYLFALAALAYLEARLGHLDEAAAVLDQLRRLDPGGRFGADRQLATLRAGPDPS